MLNSHIHSAGWCAFVKGGSGKPAALQSTLLRNEAPASSLSPLLFPAGCLAPCYNSYSTACACQQALAPPIPPHSSHTFRRKPHCCAYACPILVSAAYWRIEGNEVHDCLTSGISAGQGSGLDFMVAPWLQWDVYDLKVGGGGGGRGGDWRENIAL